MDFINLICNLILVIGFGSAFIYGLIKSLTTRKILYFQMITAAIGCAAVTRLYNVVALVCMGDFASGFNVGLVGPISCFGMLFCAEYGALDSLADKTAKNTKRASLVALIAPAILVTISVHVVIAKELSLIYRIFNSFTLATICFASYFNCKHLILSGEENEMFIPLRKYNLLALIMETLYVLELKFIPYDNQIPFVITVAAVLIVSIAILPVLEKGVAKWTI